MDISPGLESLIIATLPFLGLAILTIVLFALTTKRDQIILPGVLVALMALSAWGAAREYGAVMVARFSPPPPPAVEPAAEPERPGPAAPEGAVDAGTAVSTTAGATATGLEPASAPAAPPAAAGSNQASWENRAPIRSGANSNRLPHRASGDGPPRPGGGAPTSAAPGPGGDKSKSAIDQAKVRSNDNRMSRGRGPGPTPAPETTGMGGRGAGTLIVKIKGPLVLTSPALSNDAHLLAMVDGVKSAVKRPSRTEKKYTDDRSTSGVQAVTYFWSNLTLSFSNLSPGVHELRIGTALEDLGSHRSALMSGTAIYIGTIVIPETGSATVEFGVQDFMSGRLSRTR